VSRRSDRTSIRVISLRNAAERRNAFAEAASPTRLGWTFFDACEALHADLRYREDDAIIAKGRPLTGGEIGCYSSHYAVWKQLIDDPDADQCIVLEDDVIVDWDYLEAFAAVDHARGGHDYIRLYYKRPAPSRIVQKDFVCRATWLTEVSGYCFGTQGYLITKAGARRFVERFAHVRRPIDDEMDRSWIHGIANLAVFPFPLMERSADSGIGLARFERFAVPSRLRTRRFFANLAERAGYQLFGRRRFRFQR